MSRSSTSREPRHAPRPPRMPFALLIVGLIVGVLGLLLALNTASAANEVRRHDLAARDQRIAAQLVQLQNDVQASAAPGNLAAAAAALGMVPAGDPAFLRIDADGTVHVLGTPSAATAAPVAVAPRSPTSTARPASRSTTAAAHGGRTSTGSSAHSTAHPGARSSAASRTHGAGHTATRTTTHGAARTTASASRSGHATSSPATPTPTPTPTPNSTLPGGTR